MLIEPLFVSLILFILYRLWVNLYSLANPACRRITKKAGHTQPVLCAL